MFATTKNKVCAGSGLLRSSPECCERLARALSSRLKAAPGNHIFRQMTQGRRRGDGEARLRAAAEARRGDVGCRPAIALCAPGARNIRRRPRVRYSRLSCDADPRRRWPRGPAGSFTTYDLRAGYLGHQSLDALQRAAARRGILTRVSACGPNGNIPYRTWPTVWRCGTALRSSACCGRTMDASR